MRGRPQGKGVAVSRGSVLAPVPEATDSGKTAIADAARAATEREKARQQAGGKAPSRRRSFSGAAPPREQHGRLQFYSGSMTVYVLVVVITAATSGVLYGYDIAVAGGVQGMVSFRQAFFPHLVGQTDSDPYCKYEDALMQLYNAVMFLSGSLVALPSGYAARAYGRKPCMFAAGLLYLLGSGLQAGAANLGMLIAGRCVLGLGVGISSVTAPVYIAELAPFASRGGLATLVQAATVSGILAAQLTNYATQYIPGWGWRLSLGLSAMPACVLTVGGIILPESPSFLLEKGRTREGQRVLQMLRGTKAVDAEYADLLEAATQAASVGALQSFRNLLKPAYLPMTLVSTAVAVIQQLSGINAVIFYSPLLLESLASDNPALMNTLIIGAVNVVFTFVGILLIDRAGRRALLIPGGLQMMLCSAALAGIMARGFEGGSPQLERGTALAALVLICVFVAGFAYSWGLIVWVLGTEVQSLETRSAGMSIVIAGNFMLSYVYGQGFLSMLCAMKWGVFLFFACWDGLMVLFVYFLLPETRGVPLEDGGAWQCVFARHPIWSRVMGRKAAKEALEKEALREAAWRQAQAGAGRAADLRALARLYSRERDGAG